MSNPIAYERVKQIFENEKCKLINSYEEFIKIKEDYKDRGSYK